MTDGWLPAGTATGTTADGRPVWRVPIGDVLARVQPAYGSSDWADHRRRMLDDPDERERVTTLAAIAPTGFRQPVILDTEEGRVANGMHRLVASLVAGLTHVDVTDRYSEIERPQLRIEFALEVPPAHRFEDAHDAADSLLWSFPVGDEDWAETDSLYNADPLLGGYWYWPAERADELVAAMTARAAAHGLTFTAHTVEPHSWDEEDDL